MRGRHWTKKEEDIIRDFYTGTKESLLALMERLQNTRTYSAVKNKAYELGLPRISNRKGWVKAEENALERMVGTMPYHKIAERMGRSTTAVYSKAIRMGLDNNFKDGWYSAYEASFILGVREQRIASYIQEGILKATRHGNGEVKGNLWHIETKDLRDFIRRYPGELVGKDIDVFQLVEVLCGIDVGYRMQRNRV